jgi:Cu-processing system permease protein
MIAANLSGVVRVPAARPAREPWLDVRTILFLGRKEIRESFRNRWFVTYTAAFTLLAVGLSYLSRVGTSMSGFAGFGATAASLVNLVLLIVPLIALTVGAAGIAPERDRGTLAYLLAQPLNRLEVFVAKFLGLAAALLGTLFIGFGASALVLTGGNTDPRQLPIFLTLVGLACLLALSMLSVGLLISCVARRPATATGAAVMAWLLIVLVGDLGLMGSAILFRLRASSLLLAALANPAECFKVAVIGSFDSTLDVLGPAGLYAANTFGPMLLPVLVACLLAWTVLPLVAAAIIFTRRPL